LKTLMIIPAYNEEKSIVQTVTSLKKAKMKNGTLDYIIINDGSKDRTKEVCEENGLNYIDLPVNLGIGGAVQTGYKYAINNNYDIAIQFDGDGQHDSAYIPNLVNEIEKGADIAIGSRYVEDLSKFKSTAMRRFGINILSFLIKICTGKKIYDPTSGFRASNKAIIKLFAADYPTDYPEPDTIVTVIKGGYKVSEIPVEMNERTSGRSSISGPIKSTFYMIKVSIAIIISSLSTKGGNK
jgi:Glycosyltransferases involved in cell wall biogenesis